MGPAEQPAPGRRRGGEHVLAEQRDPGAKGQGRGGLRRGGHPGAREAGARAHRSEHGGDRPADRARSANRGPVAEAPEIAQHIATAPSTRATAPSPKATAPSLLPGVEVRLAAMSGLASALYLTLSAATALAR